jgi:hypothetical protein
MVQRQTWTADLWVDPSGFSWYGNPQKIETCFQDITGIYFTCFDFFGSYYTVFVYVVSCFSFAGCQSWVPGSRENLLHLGPQEVCDICQPANVGVWKCIPPVWAMGRIWENCDEPSHLGYPIFRHTRVSCVIHSHSVIEDSVCDSIHHCRSRNYDVKCSNVVVCGISLELPRLSKITGGFLSRILSGIYFWQRLLVL